jgi:hypothetical protein
MSADAGLSICYSTKSDPREGEILSKNPKQAARKPATKFAHLQKKMQKQKIRSRAVKKK